MFWVGGTCGTWVGQVAPWLVVWMAVSLVPFLKCQKCPYYVITRNSLTPTFPNTSGGDTSPKRTRVQRGHQKWGWEAQQGPDRRAGLWERGV